MRRKQISAAFCICVTPADHARLLRLASEDGMSVSAFIRGAVEEMLEDLGEAPLQPLLRRSRGGGGRWKKAA